MCDEKFESEEISVTTPFRNLGPKHGQREYHSYELTGI